VPAATAGTKWLQVGMPKMSRTQLIGLMLDLWMSAKMLLLIFSTLFGGLIAYVLVACLKLVMRNYLINSFLRERFGVEERNKVTISRYIKEAVEVFDYDAAHKLCKYVPYWL
jgi:hypothetical protein